MYVCSSIISAFNGKTENDLYAEYGDDFDYDDDEEEDIAGDRNTLEYNRTRVHRSTHQKRREIALVEVSEWACK